MCLVGIIDIAGSIDPCLYDLSIKTGIASVNVSGDELFDYIDQTDYVPYRVNNFVRFETLGFDSDYINADGDHLYLSGSAQQMFKNGTYEVLRMNEVIVSGNSFEYSDNEDYSIWLSTLSSDYINAKCGDVISVDVGDNKINAVVKGIYNKDILNSETDITLSDFYLSGAFVPYFTIDYSLDLLISELNSSTQDKMIDEFNSNGFRSERSDAFKAVLNIKMSVYLIAMFSLVIIMSLMLSMTKLYCNKRKGFFSIIRLLGFGPRHVIIFVFSFLQILYSLAFLISLFLSPMLYNRVVELIGELIGNQSLQISYGDFINCISYLIISALNFLAVLQNSKNIRTVDISSNLRFGVEG